MPQLGAALRTGMFLFGAVLVLGACGRNGEREAVIAAAPVRQAVERLAHHPKWQDGQGKCLCVGLYREDTVEDFPAGLLKTELAHRHWVRNWSQCAPYYSRAQALKGCGAGMSDYICSVANRNDLASGTSRVLCHVAGQSETLQNEYLQDEYDVTDENGSLKVKAVSLKATGKLYE